MIFRQLFEPETSTYTYVLGCERTSEAILIDPVLGMVERDSQVLAELGLKLKYTLDTHVHADHITAASAFRRRAGSQSLVAEAAGIACADRYLRHGDRLEVGDLCLNILHTPGHTFADLSIYVLDRVFTGDALLIGGCGRTDFQQGDAGRLYDSVHQHLFSLPDETIVFPGHDYKGRTSSTIGEEKRSNARLGDGRSREDFIALMADLKLAYPRFIDQALPANLQCGHTDAPN